MSIPVTILVFTLSYLLGSIPAAVWIGKAFHNIDVRQHGSGNAGTTNVIRVLGWKTGFPVLLIDIMKGWLAVMLPLFFNMASPGTASLINLQIISGIIAVTGHIFPVMAGFRGGKGVATVFGVLLALDPFLALACIGVFLAVLFATGIVSVSSMSAGVAFPVFIFTLFKTPSLILKIFSVSVAFVLLITHRNNIRRLMKGEESKLIKSLSRLRRDKK